MRHATTSRAAICCLTLAALLVVVAPRVAAGGPELVRDLDPVAASSDPRLIGILGDTLLIDADDGVHGREPWITDGTAAGTYLLADLHRGHSDSQIGPVGRVGSLAVFTVDMPTTGEEPWVSDGTRSGTRPLGDIRPGRSSSSPRPVASLERLLVFTADDGTHGRELWATDGTPEGTGLVLDLRPGPKDGVSHALQEEATVVSGRLVFVANDGDHGWEPWVSDGTRHGTLIVHDVRPGGKSSCEGGAGCPAAASALGAILQLDDGIHGAEPWMTDGSASGTRLLGDLEPGPEPGPDGSRYSMRRVGAAVWIVTEDAGTGTLWVIGHGDTVIRKVRALDAAEEGPTWISWARDLGGRTLLGIGGTAWATDGTPDGTQPLVPTDYWEGPPVSAAGRLFLIGNDGETGRELWVTDGTAPGTRLVRDIAPGMDVEGRPRDGAARLLGSIGDHVYLYADAEGHGSELWTSDGTEQGTRKISDVGSTAYYGSGGLDLGIEMGGRLLFVGRDAAGGGELWSTDGTDGGTGLVADIRPGTASARVFRIAGPRGWTLAMVGPMEGANGIFGDGLDDAAFDDSLYGLWRIDRPGTTMVRLGRLEPTISEPPGGLTVVGDRVFYFYANQNDNTTRLMRTDGTAPGTKGVRVIGSDHIACGGGVSYRGRFVAGCWSSWAGGSRGGLLLSDGSRRGTRFLVAYDEPFSWDEASEIHGATDPVIVGDRVMFLVRHSRLRVGQVSAALWATDGTRRGTRPVVGLDLGRRIPDYPFDRPDLTVVGRRVFFAARDARHGMEPWSSDGTARGTRMLTDLRPGPRGSGPCCSARALGGYTFSADDGRHGREPWTIDDGSGRARLIRDIRRGKDGSRPSALVGVGQVAFFTADDGKHGRELWVTDGTQRGTRLVRDIVRGSRGSSPMSLTRVGRTLYFVAADGAGRELWRTDGTWAGTRRVADLRPGPVGSDPTLLTAVRGVLYFAADDGAHGQELWRIDT